MSTDLKAEWDPVTGTVIFVRPGETPNPKTTSVEASESSSLEWRHSSSNAPPASGKARSHGIAASKFHPTPPSSTTTTATLSHSHARIRDRVLQQEASVQRQQQEYRRMAYQQLTVHKTHPLQDRALEHCRRLRREWGVHCDDDKDEHGAGHRRTLSPTMEGASSSSSSSSGLSDLYDPEAKRQQQDIATSPAKSSLVHRYKADFVRQRCRPQEEEEEDDESHNNTNSVNNNNNEIADDALFSLEPRVFGIESAVNHGKRRYLTAHVGRFLDRYFRKTVPVSRHAYELLPAGTPCRLYLDLEGPYDTHVGLRHVQEEMLTELFEELRAEVREQFGGDNGGGGDHTNTRSAAIVASLERRHIVELESSTEKKFSRHWIVHLPAAATGAREPLFRDAVAVGHFCRQWIGRLAEEQATGRLKTTRPALDKHLFLHRREEDSHGKETGKITTSCIVDLGVYTRNRLFRMLGSSKFGKAAFLTIAATNEFPFPAGFTNDCFAVSSDSRSQSANETTPTTNDDKTTTETAPRAASAKTDFTLHADAMVQTWVIPLHSAKQKHPILPLRGVEAVPTAVHQKASARTLRSSSSMTLSQGRSPYPMIDDFVLTELAGRGGTTGVIRAWSLERHETTQAPRTLTYQMLRNRWCECVGRAHKSNNIAWHCDFQLRHCYQTCFDPDCRAVNFRGTPVPLSDAVAQALDDALFDEELARMPLPGSTNVSESVWKATTGEEPAVTRMAAATIEACSVNDVDDDEAFEQALCNLNLDDLTATAVSQPSHDAVPMSQAPETASERLRRLYASVDDDSSDDEDTNSNGANERSTHASKRPSSPQSRSQSQLSRSNQETLDHDPATIRARPSPAPVVPQASVTTKVTWNDDSSEEEDLVALAQQLDLDRSRRERYPRTWQNGTRTTHSTKSSGAKATAWHKQQPQTNTYLEDDEDSSDEEDLLALSRQLDLERQRRSS